MTTSDLAEFGIAVDSKQVDQARQRLADLGLAGGKAATSINQLSTAWDTHTQSLQRFVLQQMQAQQNLEGLYAKYTQQLAYMAQLQQAQQQLTMGQINYMSALRDVQTGLDSLKTVFIGLSAAQVEQAQRLQLTATATGTTVGNMLALSESVKKVTDNLSEQQNIQARFTEVMHGTTAQAIELRRVLESYVGSTSHMTDDQALGRFIDRMKDLKSSTQASADAMAVLGMQSQDTLLKLQQLGNVQLDDAHQRAIQLKQRYVNNAIAYDQQENNLATGFKRNAAPNTVSSFISQQLTPRPGIDTELGIAFQNYSHQVAMDNLSFQQQQNQRGALGALSPSNMFWNSSTTSGAVMGASFGMGAGGPVGALVGGAIGGGVGMLTSMVPSFQELTTSITKLGGLINDLGQIALGGGLQLGQQPWQAPLKNATTGGMMGAMGLAVGYDTGALDLVQQVNNLQARQKLEEQFPQLADWQRRAGDGFQSLTATGGTPAQLGDMQEQLRVYLNEHPDILNRYYQQQALTDFQQRQATSDQTSGANLQRQIEQLAKLAEAAQGGQTALDAMQVSLQQLDNTRLSTGADGDVPSFAQPVLNLKNQAAAAQAALSTLPAYLSQGQAQTQANNVMQGLVDAGQTQDPLAKLTSAINASADQMAARLATLLVGQPELANRALDMVNDQRDAQITQATRQLSLQASTNLQAITGGQQMDLASSNFLSASGPVFGRDAAVQQAQLQMATNLARGRTDLSPEAQAAMMSQYLQGNGMSDEQAAAMGIARQIGGQNYDTQHGTQVAMAIMQARAQAAQGAALAGGATPWAARQAGYAAQASIPGGTFTSEQAAIQEAAISQGQIGQALSAAYTSKTQASQLDVLYNKGYFDPLTSSYMTSYGSGLAQTGSEVTARSIADAATEAAKALADLQEKQKSLTSRQEAEDLQSYVNLMEKYGNNAQVAAAVLDHIKTSRTVLDPTTLLQSDETKSVLGSAKLAADQSNSIADQTSQLQYNQLAASTVGMQPQEQAMALAQFRAQQAYKQRTDAIPALPEGASQAAIDQYTSNMDKAKSDFLQASDLSVANARLQAFMQQSQQYQRAMEQPFINAVTNIQSQFTGMFENIFTGGKGAFDNLGVTLRQIMLKTAADITAMLVFRPVVGGLLQSIGMGNISTQMGLSAPSLMGGSGGGSLLGGSTSLLGGLFNSVGNLFSSSPTVTNETATNAALAGMGGQFGPATPAAVDMAALSFNRYQPSYSSQASLGGAGIGSSMGGLSNLSSVASLGQQGYNLYNGGGGMMNSAIDFIGSPMGFSSGSILWGTTSAEATNAALAGMGEGVYGVATPAAESAAASSLGGTTLGSMAGGVGIGFAAGSMLGTLMNPQHSTQATIGAAGGAIAGAAIGSIIPGVGTIIGGLIGGLIGGGGGSFFGPGKKHHGSGYHVVTDANGQVQIVNPKIDPLFQDAFNQDQSQITALNKWMTDNSVSASMPELVVGQNNGVASQLPSFSGAVPSMRFTSTSQDTYTKDLFNSQISTRSFTGLDEFQKVANVFSQIFEPASKVKTIFGDLATNMDTLNKAYDSNIKQSGDVGLDTNIIKKAAADNLNTATSRELRQFTDPMGLALQDFDAGEAARLDYAKKVGADINQVEAAAARERLQIIEQYSGAASDALKNMLASVTTGTSAGETTQNRYNAALITYNAAMGKVKAGTATGNSLGAPGQDLISIARELYSDSPQFAAVYQTVLQDSIKNAPEGTDTSAAAQALARLQQAYGGAPVLNQDNTPVVVKPTTTTTNADGTTSPTITQLIEQSNLGSQLGSAIAPGLSTLADLIKTTNDMLTSIRDELRTANSYTRSILARVAP